MKALIAYFSRAHENYVSGTLKELEVGNTEAAAGIIRKLTGADIFRIDPVRAYAADYNTCIEEARAEVEKMSVRLINQLQSKIHKSARDTLEAIAKSFGARAVRFEFNDEGEQVQLNLQNVA